MVERRLPTPISLVDDRNHRFRRSSFGRGGLHEQSCRITGRGRGGNRGSVGRGEKLVMSGGTMICQSTPNPFHLLQMAWIIPMTKGPGLRTNNLDTPVAEFDY